MRAATIRRSLVFAVCALGVGCLYLAPSIAGAPASSGQSAANDDPRPQAEDTSGDDPSEPRLVEKPGRQAQSRNVATVRSEKSTTAATTAATAYDGTRRKDTDPPRPVRKIRTAKVTPEKLSLSWTPAEDNVRVIGYHIWLNGFEVASTVQTEATVAWFNADTDQNVVQVKAVDAAGNLSASSPTLVVTRPEPQPEPTTTPTDPPDPKPEATTSPEPSDPAPGDDDHDDLDDQGAQSEPSAAPGG